MLKKIKNKMKRRNTEPSMAVAAAGPSLAVAPQDNDDHDSNNTDF